MAKFFLLLRTRSVLVNEPFNNSRRSPSISQHAHPFAIKTAITATKQPFISAFRTDQRMGRTHPPHTCNHPHGAFTAKVVKNCPQHNSVKHFLLWSADSARCCAGKCGCTVAGALWNPSKIPVVFQTSSDTQDQCLATCLWHSSTAPWPGLCESQISSCWLRRLLQPPTLKHIFFVSNAQAFPQETKTF